MSGFTINNVTVSGTLVRDAEVRTIGSSGNSVTALRIAVDERYKDNSTGEWCSRPNYFDVTIWGGIGEAIARQIHKGDQVVVSGRLRWREWEKDGQKRQAVDINADSVVPVPREPRSSGSSSSSHQSAQPPAGQPQQQMAGAGSYATPPADDDIPFAWDGPILEWKQLRGHVSRW